MDERNKYFGVVYDEAEIAASLPGSPLKVNNLRCGVLWDGLFSLAVLYYYFCRQASGECE